MSHHNANTITTNTADQHETAAINNTTLGTPLTTFMITPTKPTAMTESKLQSFNFPFEKLTPIVGEPTNATITVLKRQLYANAMATLTSLGCGRLGYLGLVMPTADYKARQVAMNPTTVTLLTAIDFSEPAPDADGDAEEYKEDLRDLKEYHAMENKLKQQLLAAIEPTFLTALEDPELGFASVTCKTILAHILSEYGHLTLEDMAMNVEQLNEPWNPELPIRMLWDRIIECQRLSTAGGEPITDRTAMFTALKLLDATGLYTTYTTNWRQSNPVQTTWTVDAFKAYFNHADKDRKRQLTTKDAGYHGANLAQGNRDTTTTKQDLPATTAKKDNASTSTSFTDPATSKKIYYCWSHGGCINPSHTSSTCKFPKEGHQKEATWFDMMGGCSDMKFGKNNRNRNRGPRYNNSGNNNPRTKGGSESE